MAHVQKPSQRGTQQLAVNGDACKKLASALACKEVGMDCKVLRDL